MKRSRSLSLLLMGSVLMVGCSEQQTPEQEVFSTFTTVQECVTSGLFEENECREMALSAIAQNPKFNSLAECEQQFGQGQCQQPEQNAQVAKGETVVQPHSGGMWMPMMMGFMAGRMMGGGGFMQGAQPLFRDPGATTAAGERNFRTAGGERVRADASGRVSSPTPTMRQNLGHVAKPAAPRASKASSGGFFGGSRYGGASS